MSTSLKHYLTTIENALKGGNATEHTHRPALKALLESLDLRITATNEPKRIACGGYQVCDKWLKDRQGRQLSYDDLTHYQKMMVALHKTIELMAKIDSAIPKWPIE
jgi:hypothetical protein